MSIAETPLSEVEASDVIAFVVEKLTGEDTEFVLNEYNTTVLRDLVRSAFDNEMFEDMAVEVVVGSILRNFEKEAVRGDMSALIYVGGIDWFERDKPHDRKQTATFIQVDEDGVVSDSPFVEYNVWGRHPGFQETDEFSPGNGYQIEITEKTVTRSDGSEVTYKNLNKYRLVEDMSDLVTAAFQNVETTLGSLMVEAIGDSDFSNEKLVAMITEKLLWGNMALEFEVTSVRAIKKRTRVPGDEGKFYYKVSQDEYEPILYTADTGITQTVLGLTGTIPVGDNSITVFISFYPQRMGQYFVDSPTLADVLQNEKFLNQKPEHQADYLNLAGVLIGKTFRAGGQIRRIEAGNDPTKLIVNISGYALVES